MEVPTRRVDDLNWARLNLISVQDQIDGQHNWRVEFRQGNRIVIASCRALPELGVPHGVDNDISAALIDLFQSMDCPEDGSIIIAASELIQRAGWHHNGRYWAMLRESLDRLHTTSYEISGGWRDHPNRRWTTAKFHFIESLEYTHQSQSGLFDERTVMRLRLAKPLVASLRSGYIKPLDIEFMQSLSRPRTRVLFRMLDAMRYNPEQPDETIDAFDVSLMEWADQCKLNGRPDTIRRALQGPHDELLRRGYLHSVTYEGRGKNQRLKYEYAPEFTPISPAVLARLRKHGIADGVARQLARTYNASVLMRRIEHFERLVGSGALTIKKTAAAALVHLIKNPDQYITEDSRTRRSEPVPAKPKAPVIQDSAPNLTLEQELDTLDRNGQASFAVKRLGLLFGRQLTTLDLDWVRTEILHGRLDALKLLKDAYTQLASMEAEYFLENLRKTHSRPD